MVPGVPRSAPTRRRRDWYVWSDTVHRYEDARIIFVDSEQSNWTWDPQREAYYWHRFYNHQPDLNYENPEVGEAMLDALRFWLDLGLDGFRLDAVPYLFEREGTNCENLPPTHAFLKRVRAEVDAGYSDRVLLAEANQWPEDVVDYFGEGDECHMAFHFPVMPRMFMALRREEARPIVEILDRTPPIPDNCQWGIFLRNHDELTLEMVTDEERDYMYAEYARDPRMKLNLGIRRRLAPLLDGGRDEIELMHAILFSLPGSPVLYYGDEIGMGDNVYLGDRDGVRTPMQWTGDRNGGFSRADFAQLYLPPLMDPVFGFQAVNVEAQLRSPTSLLRWLQRFVALRKEHPVFGVGSYEALETSNPRVFAHIRQSAHDTVLCVHNLARSAQAVELDLARFHGRTPVEMTGHTAFPRIGDLPYLLTFGPRGFYWFLLPEESPECVTRGRSGVTSCSRSSPGRAGSAPRVACPRTPRSSASRSTTRPWRSRSSRCASRRGRTSTTSSRWERATRWSTSSSDRRWRRESPHSRASPPRVPACVRSTSSSRTARSCSTSCTCSSSTAGWKRARIPSSRSFASCALEHFPNAPRLEGVLETSGPPLETVLASITSLVPALGDGWELTLDSLADDPSWLPERAWRLGEVTAGLHSALAAHDSDPHFAPEEPSGEALGLVAAAIDEEISATFATLPDDDALGAVAHRSEDIRDLVQELIGVGASGLAIRTHGDYHLGQVLWSTDGDWVVIDFEGEPARSLPERRRKRSPLRDLAGMTRSFSYAADAALLLRGIEAPEGWVDACRDAFVEGYLSLAEERILPPSRAGFDRLLALYELEKLVYELHYEARNRPDWASIPVVGLLRMLETAR